MQLLPLPPTPTPTPEGHYYLNRIVQRYRFIE